MVFKPHRLKFPFRLIHFHDPLKINDNVYVCTLYDKNINISFNPIMYQTYLYFDMNIKEYTEIEVNYTSLCLIPTSEHYYVTSYRFVIILERIVRTGIILFVINISRIVIIENKMEASKSYSYLTEEDVKYIVKSTNNNLNKIINYNIINMNDQMLGYMADYYKLKVDIQTDNDIQSLDYFIKAMPKSNAAKAEMVMSMNLFEKELNFYKIIKSEIQIPGIRPWSPKLIASLKGATVYEDLDAKEFKVRNKFHTFDEQHTFQALQSLARFHASSLIYEERKRKELGSWCILDEFGSYCDRGGYTMTHPWYIQCMDGTLGVIKSHSKYKDNTEILNIIESRWTEVWKSNLQLGEPSIVYRNAIGHSDLWNNNIMFHYSDGDEKNPDDCIIVDFQAVRCQPPAGDVMLLLHCNLDRECREKNMKLFLNYYYQELKAIFDGQGISLEGVIPYQTFLESTERYRQWGLFLSACLMPTIWMNDELISEIFSDTAKYKDILTKNKRTFIDNMVKSNDSYRNKLIPICEEIIERYFL